MWSAPMLGMILGNWNWRTGRIVKILSNSQTEGGASGYDKRIRGVSDSQAGKASRNLGRVCLQVLVDEEMRWCERGGGEFRDLWSPLGWGRKDCSRVGNKTGRMDLGDKKESGDHPLILLSSSLLIS